MIFKFSFDKFSVFLKIDKSFLVQFSQAEDQYAVGQVKNMILLLLLLLLNIWYYFDDNDKVDDDDDEDYSNDYNDENDCDAFRPQRQYTGLLGHLMIGHEGKPA